MYKVPLQNPSPDFEGLEKILKGEKEPQKVYFVELGLDGEVIKYIIENNLGCKYIPPTEETKQDYQKQIIDFYYQMGYDYIPVWLWMRLNTKAFSQLNLSLSTTTAMC